MEIIFELDDLVVSIPSLDPKIWKNFLCKTELDKIWSENNLSYVDALSDYAKSHGFELMILADKENRYMNGYVFRFKNQAERLAFLLKWS